MRYIKNDDGIVDTRFGVLYVFESDDKMRVVLMPGEHPADVVEGDRVMNSADTADWDAIFAVRDGEMVSSNPGKEYLWKNEGQALGAMVDFVSKINRAVEEGSTSLVLSKDDIASADLFIKMSDRNSD